MTKLGIDIVDLSDPQLHKRDHRALKLVLNSEDQTIDHPQLYWLLWSAKEAVFKCHREAWNFAPTQIPIKFSEIDGAISFTSNEIEGKIEMTDEYILAICSDNLAEIEYEILNTNEIGSGIMVREAVVASFKDMNIDISIGADDLNLPILLPGNEPISISHHHHWSAFAYAKAITH